MDPNDQGVTQGTPPTPIDSPAVSGAQVTDRPVENVMSEFHRKSNKDRKSVV